MDFTGHIDMAAGKGDIFGKRDGQQGYIFESYGNIFIQEVGNHAPTVDQLLEAGWMKQVEVECDLSIHKLVVDSWHDDGVEIKQNVVELTDEELAVMETANFSADMAALDAQLTGQMLDDIYRMATGQITHDGLKAEYRTAVDNPLAELPVDILMQKKIDRRDVG
ncbi:MAG: hypothetical protein KAR40_13955 [Candidatus Sabulitectum sp.]|nr:hypothetical protein [Candidatus Sabulitectum sp.]